MSVNVNTMQIQHLSQSNCFSGCEPGFSRDTLPQLIHCEENTSLETFDTHYPHPCLRGFRLIYEKFGLLIAEFLQVRVFCQLAGTVSQDGVSEAAELLVREAEVDF